MSVQGRAKNKTKGFYAKELAFLQNKQAVFPRSKKKGIKKENKDACKEARERKKQYITTLETQRNHLLQQNKRLKQEIQILKTSTSSHRKASENDHMTSMLLNQYRELMIGLKQQNKLSISRSLAVLRDKFGISGRQRQKWIQQNVMRTIQLSMPLHFRILIQNVDDSHKFFDLLGGNQEMKSYRVNFGQTQKNILKEMKPKIKKARDHFNRYINHNCFRIFQNLHASWSELTRYSQQAQKIIDKIEDNLDPVFVGNLLVNLDSRRCSSEQIKEIYPINYFKSIPEERDSMSMHQMSSYNEIQPEDVDIFMEFFD